MPAERHKTPDAPDSAAEPATALPGAFAPFAAPFSQGYAAWLGALSPFSALGARGINAWRDVSVDLVQEARRINQDSQEQMRRFAELQLAMAHKTLAAENPGALAEISSQWTAQSISLASAEVQRRGEAMSRMIGLLSPAAPAPRA